MANPLQAAPVGSTEKTCGRCGEVKPLEDFDSRKASRDGRQSFCRVCYDQYRRSWYKANREKYLRQNRERYAVIKAARAKQQKDWYEANRGERAVKAKAWREANLGRQAEYSRSRRALRMQASVGEVDIDALWTGSCGICSEPMDRGVPHPHPLSPSVDHIVPLIRGGSHEQANLQFAHLRCNMSKGAKLPEGVSHLGYPS